MTCPEPASKEELSARDEFLRDWSGFCDADPVAPDFIERMEAAGLISAFPVTDDELDSFFAVERGIEPDGLIWRPTAKGRAALATGEKP